MIQRIQSIFLLLIALFSSLLFFLPYQENIADLKIIPIQLSLTNHHNTTLLIASIINAITIIGSITILFLYKNRKRQMLLCLYLSAMQIVLVGLMYRYANETEGLPVYKLPFVFPVLNFILSLLARHSIKKDEELVKSADRIR